MSFSRQHPGPGSGDTRGPSDEMLAVDAASEIRSLTLLYDRYADRLYRFFLVCTGDYDYAQRLMRRLLRQLPDDLGRYDREERTFAGWLFERASRLVRQEQSLASRVTRWTARLPMPGRRHAAVQANSARASRGSSSFEEIRHALSNLGPAEREAIALVVGAGLSTLQASEAMRLPTSLLNSQLDRAIQSLATQFGVMNPPRFREDLELALGSQTLSGEERGEHLALIHGLFRGEVLPDASEPSRMPVLEIAGLVALVILGLGVIWVWGELTTGDTRQHDAPALSDDGEVTAELANTGAEPSPTTGPDARVSASDAASGAPVADSCSSTDGIGGFHRFVNRYNQGDFATVREMLPPPNYNHPLLEVDPVSQQRLQSVFRHHDARLSGSREFTDYLRERHAAGERWDVLEAYAAEDYRSWSGTAQIERYEEWKGRHTGLSMVVVTAMRWQSPDGREEIASGQVVVDCEAGVVIQWDLHRNEAQTGEPVSVEDFVDAMAPLTQGDARGLRARIRTDQRDDGGDLSSWELVLTEAMGQEDHLFRRVLVRRLDGTIDITYMEDGSRWWLDWRGWLVQGELDGAEQPMPEEIAQTMPLLRAMPELIDESRGEVDQARNVTLTRDAPDLDRDAGARRFEVEIRDGRLGTARTLQEIDDRERVRPEVTILDADRSSGFDPSRLGPELETMFEDVDHDAPRYRVPDADWPELRLISMSVNRSTVREQYRLSWDGVRFDLAVWPSRGGVDLSSIPESNSGSWVTAVTRYSHGPLVWAHRQFLGYPTDALWDDGRYRFELAVDRESVEPGEDWDLRELIRLADALSDPADGPAEVRDRGRGRTSRYPVPSMFNY